MKKKHKPVKCPHAKPSVVDGKRGYGWIPQIPDKRDQAFYSMIPVNALPPILDLTSSMPPVYDQGQLGSCTANGIAACVEHQYGLQKLPMVMPSRLFIYYFERAIENTVCSDSGAQIRDGIKVVASQGVCPETEWPYDITQFTVEPTTQCQQDAVKSQVTSYSAVQQDIGQIQAAIASGFCVVFGFTVYESFESESVAQTGLVPMPQPNESVLGGHCVVAVGYDVTKGLVKCRNSWGSGWGDAGYFYMPFAYITDPDLASDFWVIKLLA